MGRSVREAFEAHAVLLADEVVVERHCPRDAVHRGTAVGLHLIAALEGAEANGTDVAEEVVGMFDVFAQGIVRNNLVARAPGRVLVELEDAAHVEQQHLVRLAEGALRNVRGDAGAGADDVVAAFQQVAVVAEEHDGAPEVGEFVLVAAELVLAEHERQAFFIDAVEGEGEWQTAFDAAEHGEQLGPVLQDTRLHAAAALVGHSAQDFGVAHGEACLHLRPLFLHVERVAGAAEALYVLQFGEAGALFVGEHGLREHEEDAAVEEGDVERGHFLAADDDSTFYEGHLSVLVVRAAHLHAAHAVVRALHELQYLWLHVLVLVFVEVDHGIHRIPRLLVQAGERGVAEVGRTVARGEEGHERGTAVAFAGSLRAEEVEDGEGGGAALYDVAEAGGEPVEQAHAAVLSPYAAELLHVVGEGDVVEGAVGEAALQAVGTLAFVFGVEGVGGHWQEETLGGFAFFRAAHDAVGVRSDKLPVGVHAVGEYVEALAAVVAHLVDDGGGFGLFVEVRLQLQHVVFVALEEVVAHAFEFLAEALEAV